MPSCPSTASPCLMPAAPSHPHPSTRGNRHDGLRVLPWLLAFGLGIGGCGHTPLPKDSAIITPSAPIGSAAPPAPAAAAASSPAHTGASDTALSAQTSAVSSPEVNEVRLPPSDPDSYAQREDARRLAQELAQRHDLDPDWVWSVLSQARFKDSVPKLMMPPATPTAKNWTAYRARFLESPRIKAGAQFWKTHEAALQRAETQYGVPASVIAGVLGVETQYGRTMGRYRVLDALATLSLDFPKGRSDRSAFFQQELGEFLLMCQEQKLEPTAVLGSFAGAIGWPQFMPSSIRKFAVDFDGDGRIDLINSPVDAIGSIAHYLAEHGWQRGQPAYYSVTPPTPGADLDALLAPDILPTFSARDMEARGATLSDAGRRHEGLLALVLLHNGGQRPTLVAGTANFYAVTRYNQSSYYALAVVQLGDAVAKEWAKQAPRN